MATSVNGWSALTSSSRLLHTWTGPGSKTRLRLRHGSAGFLMVHMAVYFDRQVEDIDYNYRNGELDDWAYAYRPVRGYENNLSNHSSGTAIDLNATDHPLGVNNSFSSEDEAKIQRRLRRYHGCIQWGGNYHSRKDEMHFELDQRLAVCERVARGLLTSPVGKEILKANPGQERVIRS